MELIPGIEFDFGGGRLYTIPPLSLGALQNLQGKLTALNSAEALTPETISTVLQATHSALRRNYPDLTLEEVSDLVDVSNMHEVILCVIDISGMRRKADIEQKKQQSQLMATAPVGLD